MILAGLGVAWRLRFSTKDSLRLSTASDACASKDLPTKVTPADGSGLRLEFQKGGRGSDSEKLVIYISLEMALLTLKCSAAVLKRLRLFLIPLFRCIWNQYQVLIGNEYVWAFMVCVEKILRPQFLGQKNYARKRG